MQNVRIFVDTSADIPPELAEKYRIESIHFLSVFGETTYVSGIDLDNRAFYEKLKTAEEFPKTQQTPMVDMYETLKKAAEESDAVIYFTISSKGSGQYNTARMAAEQIREENPALDVRIVDTMKYSLYIAAGAIHARELLDQGVGIDEAIARSKAYMESWEVYILVDSLSYLEKGGRITKTTAIIGTLLDIKPVLTIREGLIEPLEKIRGKKKIYEKLMALIKENPEFDDEKKEFMIVHSDAEAGQKLRETVKTEFGVEDVYIFSEFGPIVGTHIGPGALAVIFRKRG